MWSGVACARSDSLEGRARPVGAGRPVVPRGMLAGAWPPRNGRGLTLVRARARASGRGAGQAGLVLRAGPKDRRRPVKENKMIFFLLLK